jgi:hypothetical protein
MALALGLVGQPVQPYLTTGATDYVNSVQKGKEDAIKTEALKTTSQKSALDLLTAQKKQKDEQWYSDNAGALSRKVKTLDVADEDLAKMAQVNPEYHKVLQTERADAVKNFNASNLAYLGSSTDKAKSAQEIIQASEAHGMTIPDQFKQSPETLMQYLKVINAGSKAFDLKNVSKDESGDIITTDITGNTTDIKPAAVKAEKTQKAPVTWVVPNGRKETTYGYDANGKQIVLGVKNLDAPKSDKTADHPVYFNTTLTGDAFLKTLSPVDQAHVKALNEGREPFPTAKMMASNPYYERLADAVAQYNPDFDATAFSTRKNANTAFTTGIQGRQLLAFGSAVKHLETLGGLIDALKNKDTIQLNRLNNLWEKQTGQSAVTNFEAAKGIVAKEIMKSIVTGGGGVEERQELSRLMDAAKSPEQLRGVVDTYYDLMKAQQENLIIQRDAAGLSRSSLPDYTKHSADEGKKPTGNQGKQPQTPYEWYVLHWNDAQKKGDKVRMQRLTEEAKKMGIAK